MNREIEIQLSTDLFFLKLFIQRQSVHYSSRRSVAHSYIREECTDDNEAKHVSCVPRLLISGKILYDLAKYVKKKYSNRNYIKLKKKLKTSYSIFIRLYCS